MKNLPRLLLLSVLCPACSFVEGKLATDAPPLADMEEPLAMHQEADDEAERQLLPAGGFTGAYVTDARQSLEEMEDEPEGLLVSRVIENSPADAAGLREGDLILQVGGLGGKPVAWASQWRAIELAAEPGSTLSVRYDRAGELRTADIVVVARVRPADRPEVERYREEDRVGIVVRTATETESRAAGLGPGGGAVVVGLSRASPWRRKGLRFGDLLTRVGGTQIAHPNVLLKAIRDAAEEEPVEVVFVRDGTERTLRARVTQRKRHVSRITIPVLFDFERDRGTTTRSILLGLYKRTTTPAAWEIQFLWLFRVRGGDADRLEELSR